MNYWKERRDKRLNNNDSIPTAGLPTAEVRTYSGLVRQSCVYAYPCSATASQSPLLQVKLKAKGLLQSWGLPSTLLERSPTPSAPKKDDYHKVKCMWLHWCSTHRPWCNMTYAAPLAQQYTTGQSKTTRLHWTTELSQRKNIWTYKSMLRFWVTLFQICDVLFEYLFERFINLELRSTSNIQPGLPISIQTTTSMD